MIFKFFCWSIKTVDEIFILLELFSFIIINHCFRNFLCFFFLFIEFTFILGGGVLVLLVFRDQIMLLSASVNSISSIPSPVYQCKKAFRRNIAVNCSEIRLKSSWMAVELPMKVADILRPRGGMSQTAVLTLLGIHSTK